MDNDTKKILLLIARALQMNALAQLANIDRPEAWQADIAEERVMAAALLAKINNEEKKREAHEKLMDEIRMDETWSRVSEAQEKLMDQAQMEELQKLLWRRADKAEKNNA